MIKACKKDATEGDVEAQVVLPIIQGDSYLSIPLEYLKSKEYLAPLDIDKGRSKKIGYFPDFAVFINSLPVCVIEAKSPSNSAEDAYAEACLYAHEVNRSFSPQINPCRVVIGTNGITVRAGFWDSSPSLECSIDDLLPGSSKLNSLRRIACAEVLISHADEISQKIRFDNYKRPFNQGEGPALINSKVSANTFSADLGPVLLRYFTSHDQNSDKEIFDKAYIPSTELLSYDRNLESFLKDRITRSKRSGRTELRPTKGEELALGAVVTSHKKSKPIGGALQLITGAVGAGKSLFMRRYKEFLQKDELKQYNHWSFLDFNNAPPQLLDAEEWVCREFVLSLLQEGAPIDLKEPADQERLFAPKLAERQAFYDRMNAASPNRGDLERARDIEQWRQDPIILSDCVSRYLQGDRGENLIVVFDNVDRRDTADQLACFQLALWFMGRTRALLLLQMRDVTFEVYKNEPPLDTYRSGLIFHISPPRFIDVVRRRLELSLESLAGEAPDIVTYILPSGSRISYPKTRAGEFLNAIYSEVFQRPRNISTVLEALSGRNVREALGMFMSIITSGHMPEDLITSIATGSPVTSIPEYRIIKILMRGDYRFYNENSGFISNIFYCDNNWERPSNFIISEILFWLIGKRKVAGDNGHMGYFSVTHIADELELLGFVRNDVQAASKYALKNGLIEADTLSVIDLGSDDCVKATASGWVHMRILSERIEYLHAVLPTTPIYDGPLRDLVFDRMKIENKFGHLRRHQAIQLVKDFRDYLRQQKATLDSHNEYARRKNCGANYILSKIQVTLEHQQKSQLGASAQIDLLDD